MSNVSIAHQNYVIDDRKSKWCNHWILSKSRKLKYNTVFMKKKPNYTLNINILYKN